MLEIKIKGQGELSIALVDRKGKILLRKRLIVSGSDRVEGRSQLPLELETKRGLVPVVPILTKNDPDQEVTFDGRDPASFSQARCRQLKYSPKLLEQSLESERTGSERDGLTVVLGSGGSRKH